MEEGEKGLSLFLFSHRKPGDDGAERLDSHSTMRSEKTRKRARGKDFRARCKRRIISRRVSNLIASARGWRRGSGRTGRAPLKSYGYAVEGGGAFKVLVRKRNESRERTVLLFTNMP